MQVLGKERNGDLERKLFCELSPFAYAISRRRCICRRTVEDLLSGVEFADERLTEPLPFVIYRYNSLIRRQLGNVDMRLQENKAVNLSIAAPKIDRVVIRSGQTFSLWHLVGSCTAQKGYREGLTISGGRPTQGIGGGLCQLTNLIHWMVLHTDLEITEHHHHDQVDLFPDYKRVIPFGMGTSIFYNYLDYRFRNNTDRDYQLIVYTTDRYLCGEIRSSGKQEQKYHIVSENNCFTREQDGVYRNGEVYRQVVDCRTGNLLRRELLKVNHAKVCYDTSGLEIVGSVNGTSVFERREGTE